MPEVELAHEHRAISSSAGGHCGREGGQAVMAWAAAERCLGARDLLGSSYDEARTWAEGRERLLHLITVMMDANEWYRFYTSLTTGICDKLAGRMVRRGIYICAFSNNQWNIASEMGWSSRYSRELPDAGARLGGCVSLDK